MAEAEAPAPPTLVGRRPLLMVPVLDPTPAGLAPRRYACACASVSMRARVGAMAVSPRGATRAHLSWVCQLRSGALACKIPHLPAKLPPRPRCPARCCVAGCALTRSETWSGVVWRRRPAGEPVRRSRADVSGFGAKPQRCWGELWGVQPTPPRPLAGRGDDASDDAADDAELGRRRGRRGQENDKDLLPSL